eukprot:scaffold41892_cov79-Cyclotella_meneghiniana.AAC.3
MASSSVSTDTLSIGPDHLRTIVQDASRQEGCDANGIVWLEHLNLVVGDMEMAKQFYVEFLGLTIDTNVKHFNLGQQQFHLAANGDPPQQITGSICLTVPSLSNIQQRTQSARDALSGTLFSINERHPKMMSVTCPWGNTFHLYDISIDDDNKVIDQHPSPHKMVNLHREGGEFGPTRMAVRGQPGIKAIEIACREGTVNKIAQFYENITDQDLESMNGVHICIYIANFQSMYKTLEEQKLIWTNPRFTHLDSCDTWEEACASRTFRFKNIVDVETKVKLMELEHETRPMMHGQYLKVPRYIPN